MKGREAKYVALVAAIWQQGLRFRSGSYSLNIPLPFLQIDQSCQDKDDRTHTQEYPVLPNNLLPGEFAEATFGIEGVEKNVPESVFQYFTENAQP